MIQDQLFLVYARAANGTIGKDGGLPWHIPADLKHFKEDVREMTSGFECGVGVDGFNDFYEDDVLEVFHKETSA